MYQSESCRTAQDFKSSKPTGSLISNVIIADKTVSKRAELWEIITFAVILDPAELSMLYH